MPNIEPAMSDKQIILSALGITLERDDLSIKDTPLFKLSCSDCWVPSEEGAYADVEFEPNFCFEWIVPFMCKDAWNFECWAIPADSNGEGEFFSASFWKRKEDKSRFGPIGDGPTVESAIQEAFISYLKEQQV